MTREEAIEEINKVFEPAFANYIITALTEGATASDKALEKEPCEAVSRADTLQSFESYCENNCQYSKKQRDVMCGACMMGDAIEIVENLPPVTPKQRTGKWIQRHVIGGRNIEMTVCSECGEEFSYDAETGVSEYNFCPNCGAKMGGESE